MIVIIRIFQLYVIVSSADFGLQIFLKQDKLQKSRITLSKLKRLFIEVR